MVQRGAISSSQLASWRLKVICYPIFTEAILLKGKEQLVIHLSLVRLALLRLLQLDLKQLDALLQYSLLFLHSRLFAPKLFLGLLEGLLELDPILDRLLVGDRVLWMMKMGMMRVKLMMLQVTAMVMIMPISGVVVRGEVPARRWRYCRCRSTRQLLVVL